MAHRVSGYANVVLAVAGGRASSEFVIVRSSLLAGGYLGSIATQVSVPIQELLAPFEDGTPPFAESLPGGLRPVSLDDAAWLAWGSFAYAAEHGVLGDVDGCMPGLGAIDSPSSNIDELTDAYLESFTLDQIDIAEDVAAWHASEPSDPRSEAPDVLTRVTFACGCAPPIEMAAVLDAHPLELPYDLEKQAWLWRPIGDRPSPVLAGSLRIDRDLGLVIGRAPNAESAARLASRLEVFSPDRPILGRVRWDPVEMKPEPAVVVPAGRRRT